MYRNTLNGRGCGAGRWAQLLDAFTDGVANGLRTHVPGAVGIVLKTAALCASLLLAHLLLGVTMAASGLGAGGVVVIYSFARALRLPGEHDSHQ